MAIGNINREISPATNNHVSGEATASIQAASLPIALWLPNGSPLYNLQIDVTISYRDDLWNFSFTLPYI
jgi:hypothetical protein